MTNAIDTSSTLVEGGNTVKSSEKQGGYPIPNNAHHASNQLKSVIRSIDAILGHTGAVTFVDSSAFFGYVAALRETRGIHNISYGATDGGGNMRLFYEKAGRSVTVTYPLAINYEDIDGKRVYTATVEFSEIERDEY